VLHVLLFFNSAAKENGMKLFKLLTVCIFLPLGGCASLNSVIPEQHVVSQSHTSEQASSALSAVTVCCNSYSTIQYKDMDTSGEWTVNIDQQSPAFQFPEGKSYFTAYRLPSNRGGFTISIASLFGKSVLIPQVMLLDGEFNITRIISADKFEYQAPKLLRPEQYYNALSIDRTHEGNIKNESYMIIYTPASVLSQASVVDSEEMRYAKTRGLVEPRNGKVSVPHSSWGTLELDLTFLKPSTNDADIYIPAEVSAPAAVATTAITAEKTSTTSATTNNSTDENKILPETESYYNDQINKAVADKDMKKAVSLYKEAKKLGSKTAESTLLKAIE
jgi:maltose operon protein